MKERKKGRKKPTQLEAAWVPHTQGGMAASVPIVITVIILSVRTHVNRKLSAGRQLLPDGGRVGTSNRTNRLLGLVPVRPGDGGGDSVLKV